ncbi:MAG: hypothetical protein HRU72_00250 [Planctomycetia bacterium]|mgnify:CR=1 FL=1|nr:hypothetical protein [Candidatus Brocadia sp.]QOJ05097.1 MAG: hypothetical protein HRU72_00250 [Planctomycetia bacterium]TVL98008.1 MAG: hypothetical protein CV082_02030 [Candidatus Brocadia sp. BL1]HQU30022.1 BglII/BstYI family type II restriction endonuclease [Candidatus Brocadia sapporoensis]
MNFKHLVGKSTLKEGITIHRNYESFFESPKVGDKKEITLIFGDYQNTRVTLRKLNNIRQHVQIKYTTKSHVQFINWLNDIFKATKSGRVGEFLEFEKISTDVYQLIPITIEDSHNTRLYIADSMHYKSLDIADKDLYLGEIESIVNSIKFQIDEGQSYYNKKLEQAFIEYSWQKEGRAIPELDLKYDFRKNGIQIEVEFGNARSYYQDYIKFMLSYCSRQINLGMLITPTFDFANILCEIGKQKALLRGRKSYSGMMHYEKAYKEFTYLKNIFDMPIVILGIDINYL